MTNFVDVGPLEGRQQNKVGPTVGVSFRAGDALTPNGVRDLVRHAVVAEELGFYEVDAPDHVMLTDDNGNYPAGTWRWETQSLWPDPLVVLSAIAAVTSRINLTTSILVVPLRSAPVIAKMAATLDNLAGGRLRLGVGAGWLRPEFDAVGVPFLGRTQRMEDSIGACRALWTQAPATFSSETVSFSDAWCRPVPPRAGGIPFLIAGPPTRACADRVARLAEGWNPMEVHEGEVRDGIGYLHDAFEAAGRDPAQAIVRLPASEAVVKDAFTRDDPATLADHVTELGERGVTDVKIYLAGLIESAADVTAGMTWLRDACGIEPA